MKPLSVLYLLLFTITLSAQNNTWTYFSPALDVSCLAASGNTILAGTKGAGIIHFDTSGNRTNYHTGNTAIPNDTINQIAIDAKGYWWIQHSGGISAFNTSSWQTWTLLQTGLPSNAIIRALKPAPDSSLYVATDKGVAIFKNGAWVILNTTNSGLPSNNVWDMAFNPDGKVYYATSSTGLVVQDGTNWTSYTTANTGIPTMNNVYAVAITTNGTVWALGGMSPALLARIIKFEGGVWSGFNGISIGITSTPMLREITAAIDGSLWLTGSGNVSVFANQGWTHFYNNPDIGCGTIGTAAPAIAGDGHVWIQNTCQLAVFDGSEWDKPGTGLPGPGAGVFYTGIAEDTNGGIWMGTEFGESITRFQDDIWEQYYPTDFGATQNDVFVVQASADGAVWFGLENAEILQFKNGVWSFWDTCASIFTSHLTLASATAPNGDQWFSFFSTNSPMFTSGLARFSANGTWQMYTPSDVPFLQNSYLRNIVFDSNGAAWLSTSFKGILKYNGTSWDTITTNNSALPSNRVFDLAFAPDGQLWACTDKGLAVFDGQNWITITSSNTDLPSNLTYRIAFDQAGGMYIGFDPETPGTTGATVAVLRNGIWSLLTPPGWENTTNEIPDAFTVDSHNQLWFAELTAPGAYRYDPMLVNTTAPQAEVLQMYISPNPCTENCTIKLNTVVQAEVTIRVSNTLGQTMLNSPMTLSNDSNIPVDVSKLKPGLYWVGIWGENKLLGRTSFIKM